MNAILDISLDWFISSIINHINTTDLCNLQQTNKSLCKYIKKSLILSTVDRNIKKAHNKIIYFYFFTDIQLAGTHIMRPSKTPIIPRNTLWEYVIKVTNKTYGVDYILRGKIKNVLGS